MALFSDSKETLKAAAEIKEYAEVLRRLSDEVKVLRKEVEYISSITKKNEETLLHHEKELQETVKRIKDVDHYTEIVKRNNETVNRQEKTVNELHAKIKKLLEILELEEKHITIPTTPSTTQKTQTTPEKPSTTRPPYLFTR